MQALDHCLFRATLFAMGVLLLAGGQSVEAQECYEESTVRCCAAATLPAVKTCHVKDYQGNVIGEWRCGSRPAAGGEENPLVRIAKPAKNGKTTKHLGEDKTCVYKAAACGQQKGSCTYGDDTNATCQESYISGALCETPS